MTLILPLGNAMILGFGVRRPWFEFWFYYSPVERPLTCLPISQPLLYASIKVIYQFIWLLGTED